jgi:hypothetical protein
MPELPHDPRDTFADLLVDRISSLERAMAMQGASLAILSKALVRLAVLQGRQPGGAVAVTEVLRAVALETAAQASRLKDTSYEEIVADLWARYRAEAPCEAAGSTPGDESPGTPVPPRS